VTEPDDERPAAGGEPLDPSEGLGDLGDLGDDLGDDLSDGFPEFGDDLSKLDRGDMTELLRAVGVEDEEIAEARSHHHLELLAIEHLVVPEATVHDIDAVVESTGLSAEQVARLWRSLGFVEPRPGDHLFTDVDVDMLRTIGQLLAMGWIDDELTVQMARVIGWSLSRIASALIDSIEPTEGAPMLGTDDDFASVAPLLLPMLLQIMDYVWRRHIQAEARARMARDHAEGDPDHRAVGFADLVGFTALSQQIDPHELAEVVDRFESIAYDTVNRLGGRVVKMIGDEVMFSVPDEAAALEIALSLAETYRDDDELSDVRVGLAAGPVLMREADLFGPVVNRASRIVNLAFPGSVVCSSELVEAVGESAELAWKSIGTRNLKDIGKVQLYVVRRASTEVRPRSAREEMEAKRAERREARVAEMDAKRGERQDRRRR
jgi:adenylate cyclase